MSILYAAALKFIYHSFKIIFQQKKLNNKLENCFWKAFKIVCCMS